MSNVPSISDAEYAVMKIVWAHAPISTNDVVEMLEKTTNWKPKTIQTLLARLVKKGALRYEKSSRVYVYMPLIQETDVLALESDTFLQRFYDGAANAMMVNLVERDKLSQDELEALKRLLEEKLTEGQ